MDRKSACFACLLAMLVVSSGWKARFAQAQQPPANLSGLEEEATCWLQGLLRINTTNPPGNELEAAKYIATILQKEGMPSEIYESAPGRGFLVARLSAGPIPNPSRALLLMAHLDVVGVDRSKWKVDPFGGAIENGYLYGRGAIDDKGMLAANMAVLVELKRAGVKLDRDVILLAEGDEEQGGQYGMQFAIDKYWDKIAAGYALNEEGRVIVKDGEVQFVAIQASEKVPVNVEVIAMGTSGHASVPRQDNPIVHLAAAIAKIGAYEAPAQLNAVTESYFEQLAPVEDPEIGKWMRALEMPERKGLATRKLSEASPVWNSMMRDTIAPTILQAGFRANVVPSEARATLNIRLLPGNAIGPLIDKLKALVNDPQIRFEIEPSIGEAAPSSSLDSALYLTIEKVSHEEFPGAAVVPVMSTGATDSAALRLHDVQAYGLIPFPLTEDDVLRMHADNERIPVASFHKGIEFLYHIVEAFAAAP